MVEIKGMELVETISQNSDDSIVVFTCSLALIFLFVNLISLVLGCVMDMPKTGIVVGFIMSLVFIIPLTLINYPEMDLKDKIQYKVILTEAVNMEEFLSTYTIISQEGKILTVEEIEK